MEDNKPNNVIKLNLCLAGAISAGAYTAGVIDYLLETLERWEKAKELQKLGKLTGLNKVPEHDLIIEVITGASAGGIEGGFLLMQNKKNFNVFKENGIEVKPDWYVKESISYDAWVNLTETKEKPLIIAQLLSTDDLVVRKFPSLMNSVFFDLLTKKFVEQIKYDCKDGKKYIAKDAEIALSITNISGLQNAIPFNQATSSVQKTSGQTSSNYVMQNAKDIAYFKTECDENVNDIDYSSTHFGAIPLKIDNSKEAINFKLFGSCLMATSAFPIGFAPRKFSRKPCFILDNPLLTPDEHFSNIKRTMEPVEFWYVDGGAVNNEPFELAAYLAQRKKRDKNLSTEEKITTDTLAKEYRDENKNIVNENEISTILMIDPFPTNGELQNKLERSLNMFQSAKSILNALRQQPLVKAPQIYDAIGTRDYSKFMLAPKRKLIEGNGRIANENNGGDAIACGLLDGFGGFLDKAFRIHDYELGRFNCQHFIQKWFGVEVNSVATKVNDNNFLKLQSNDDSFNYLLYKNQESKDLITKEIYPFLPDIKIVDAGDKFMVERNLCNNYDENEVKNNAAPFYPKWPKSTISEFNKQLQILQPLFQKRILKLGSQAIKKVYLKCAFKLLGGHKTISTMLEDIIKKEYDNRNHIRF